MTISRTTVVSMVVGNKEYLMTTANKHITDKLAKKFINAIMFSKGKFVDWTKVSKEELDYNKKRMEICTYEVIETDEKHIKYRLVTGKNSTCSYPMDDESLIFV